ncbi:esterase E4-like isoform X2 [Bacillus rossius redtenbacheri]|uniref:esterase E4-like isoform X2 n=1 Tax=Bacillus rossius redtenbacheri TaxID=93214 RepID=UPI002FDCDE3F
MLFQNRDFAITEVWRKLFLKLWGRNSLPDGSVLARTKDGLLRGKVATSIWNKPYYSFQGVPFAQPPVGELRFKSPRPIKPWRGVRNATKDVSYCYQAAVDYVTVPLSEDCLYLDVYVSTAARVLPGRLLPVLVWIHGGGFNAGSGIQDYWGPDNLVNIPTVFVSFEYRKGVLGFMNVEHPEVTSNAGMKDQVLALRWIQRNIASFGGDPRDVTVFGISAGGWSVELLLMSPMAKGLFHRAICQSGSTLMARADYNQTRGAYRLAEVLGHNATDRDDLVRFLRSAAPEDLITGQELARTEADGTTVALSQYPVVDAKVQEGREVFLPDTPENLLRAGRLHPVPYIIGVASQEMKMYEQYYTAESYADFNSDFEQFIPAYLNLTKGSPESKRLAAKIKKFYFGDKDVSYETLQELTDLRSDNFVVHPAHRSANFYLGHIRAPLYIYLFTYDGTLRIQQGNYSLYGPAHADDAAYLFYVHYIPYHPTADDVRVIDLFSQMWYDFGWSGNPTLRQSRQWLPARPGDRAYLQLDVELRMRADMYKERMDFWDDVYRTYGFD